MRTLLIIGVAALVALGLSSAAPSDNTGSIQTLELPAPEPLALEQRSVKQIPPLPVLPNIKVLTKKLWRADRDVVKHQMIVSGRVLKFFENQDRRWMRAPRQEKCWAVPWQRTCTVARHSYRLHLTLHEAAKQKLWRSLPLTNDWQTALRLAQRPYPGTYNRGMQIVDHEGGRGDWVWNNGVCGHHCVWRGYHVGGSPDVVGGWAQFRYSTFIVYWPAVVADLKRRGWIIPDLGWARPFVVRGVGTGYGPWLSPLGQALTVAYMHYYGKQGRHWPF